MPKSSVCIDASLIVRTLIPGPFSVEALQLLGRWQQAQTALMAPILLAFEVTSAIRRSVYAREITPARGEQAFAAFLHLPIRLSSQRGMFPLAWNLAKELQRPRAYDTAYLALAQLVGCEFWTADERLYNAVQARFSWVKWIGHSIP